MTRVALAVAVYAVFPFLLPGVIVRTKARWAGRKGPPMFQLAWDVLRLLRKDSVRSGTTTLVFVAGSWITLVTALALGAIVPTLAPAGVAAFAFDFVVFAYLSALGRMCLLLCALDTGSAFEGMGASREATFSALVEPALFLALATFTVLTPDRSLGGLLTAAHSSAAGPAVVIACGVTLLIQLQVESARIPVDDPNTHLELTMIHEVMVLDHSGPELAAVQLGAAVKMTALFFLLATLLNPAAGGLAYAAWSVGLVLGLAVLVGFVESAIARFRLSTIPHYAALALSSSAFILLASALTTGVQP